MPKPPLLPYVEEHCSHLDIVIEDGVPHLGEHVDSVEGEEAHDVVWSRYCDIQDELHSLGLRLVDPQLEHDYISSPVGFVDDETPE